MLNEHIERFIRMLEVEENASPHTLRNYASDLNQLSAFAARRVAVAVADLRCEVLDQTMLRSFLIDILRRNRKSSAARKLSAVKRFVRYLLQTGALVSDPSAGITTPKKEQQLPAHLSVDDMFRLLEAPDLATPVGARDRALLEVTYSCGLRVSELVGLDWSDVDASLALVRVRGKGNKERVVPIGRTALAGARAPTAPASGSSAAARRAMPRAVFLNRRGGRLTARSVARARRRLHADAADWPASSARTPCATASPRTCSAPAPTCAPSRSCSATPACRPRRTTRTSISTS